MRFLKWGIIVLFWGGVIGFFHYSLPQRDIARITDTYVERIDFGSNSLFWAHAETGEAASSVNRDVFFIQTFRRDGKPMIYRNEDTGWGWPPYFKFSTSNLQAEASDLESKTTTGGSQWVIIRHYGWRNEFLSIYPNAVGVRAISGPDHALGLPWLNMVILSVVALLWYAVWVRWRRFRAAYIDPRLERARDNWEESHDRARIQGSKLWRKWRDWRGGV
jgi:hypothetical protein